MLVPRDVEVIDPQDVVTAVRIVRRPEHDEVPRNEAAPGSERERSKHDGVMKASVFGRLERPIHVLGHLMDGGETHGCKTDPRDSDECSDCLLYTSPSPRDRG